MAKSNITEILDAMRRRYSTDSSATEMAVQVKGLSTELLNLLDEKLKHPDDILTFEVTDPKKLAIMPDLMMSSDISTLYVIGQVSPTIFTAQMRTMVL